MIQPIPAIVVGYRNPAALKLCEQSFWEQTHTVSLFTHHNDDFNEYVTIPWNRRLCDAFKIGSDYCILATQDIILRHDCIQNLAFFMDTHDRCAIAGVKQIASDGDTIVHGGCTIAYPAGHHRTGSVSRGDCARSAKMPWVNGSLMMVRMEAVREFGLFDKRMYLCGIDSDICYTARSRGWDVWYCAEAAITHDGGISRKPPSIEVASIMQSDMMRWKNKWIGSRMYADLSTEFNYSA